MTTISLKHLLLTLIVLTAIAAACVVSYRAGAKSTVLERTGPHESGPISPVPTSTSNDDGSTDAPKFPN